MANDKASDVDRAWELMKKIGFAMLVTRDGDKLRARPMSAYLERENNAVYFLTDARRHKDEEIARNSGINLSFADASDQKYVSITGTAIVSNDRAKIKHSEVVGHARSARRQAVASFNTKFGDRSSYIFNGFWPLCFVSASLLAFI